MPVLFGVTSGGVLIPLQVDANGVVSVSAVITTLPTLPAGDNNIGNVDVVTLPSLPSGSNEIGSVLADNRGLVGGAQQKDPIRFGYSNTIQRYWNSASLSAGTNTINDSAVPAGQVWVITAWAWRYGGTSPTRVRNLLYMGGTGYQIKGVLTPISGHLYDMQGWFVLKEGHYLRNVIYGATAGDIFNAYATGFRVDIDQ